MSPKPCFARCALSAATRLGAFMSGTRRRSSFATARVRQDRLAARAGVAADEPLDVDGRLRRQPLVRLAPRQRRRSSAATPSCFFAVASSSRCAAAATIAFSAAEIGRGCRRSRRSRACCRPADTSVSSACTRCHAGLSTRALLLEWTSFAGPRPHVSPLETSSQLDDALGAEAHRHDAVRVLRGRRHEDADAAARAPPPPPAWRTTCGEVRRADLLFALGDEHEVDGQLPARAAERVERGEERRLGALLVHRAAPDDDLAEAGLVDDRGLEGRRGPLGRIDLLDVVHEVERRRCAAPRRRASRRRPAGRRSEPSRRAGSRRRASIRIMSSHPSVMPRFSAAIDGCRIQSCRRRTASALRLPTSARTRSRPDGEGCAFAAGERARPAAPAATS